MIGKTGQVEVQIVDGVYQPDVFSPSWGWVIFLLMENLGTMYVARHRYVYVSLYINSSKFNEKDYMFKALNIKGIPRCQSSCNLAQTCEIKKSRW